jgi:hypothetical protein
MSQRTSFFVLEPLQWNSRQPNGVELPRSRAPRAEDRSGSHRSGVGTWRIRRWLPRLRRACPSTALDERVCLTCLEFTKSDAHRQDGWHKIEYAAPTTLYGGGRPDRPPGGVSERSKETVLKTVRPLSGSRGFKSHPLRKLRTDSVIRANSMESKSRSFLRKRDDGTVGVESCARAQSALNDAECSLSSTSQSRRGGRVVEGARLLSE